MCIKKGLNIYMIHLHVVSTYTNYTNLRDCLFLEVAIKDEIHSSDVSQKWGPYLNRYSRKDDNFYKKNP
jgi:hypothetical protein